MNLSWRLAVFKTLVWSLSTVHIFGAAPKASRQVVAAAAIKKSNNKRRREESDQGRRRGENGSSLVMLYTGFGRETASLSFPLCANPR